MVGIKGTGMSALAQLLTDLGHFVMGSDVDEDYKTSMGLIKRQIEIKQFNQANITSEYIYIISSAYDILHVEVKEIMNMNYPFYYYHDFIASIKGYHLAISGTHGKTTTTTLVKKLLSDKKCAYVIGDGSGGATINYDYFIYEACEYRNHFLSYYPNLLVITNIELDHPDFFQSVFAVVDSFKKIASQSKMLIVNGDDSNIALIKHPHKITYGFDEANDYQIKIIKQSDKGFNILLNNFEIIIPYPGKHMIYNCVASIIVGISLGIDLGKLQEKLLMSSLPSRRMEVIEWGSLILVDDYAHHPTEIIALYEGLKQKYPNYSINTIFQPHTYSRTLALKDDFIKALTLFDLVYLDDVFTSSREQINNELQNEIDSYFTMFKKFNPLVLEDINPNKKQVWVFMGAGIINQYIKKLI